MCHRQCQRRSLSIALNFHAERSSPLTAGDLLISNYTILNTIKLHSRRIWLFATCPSTLNPLRIVNSILTKIHLKILMLVFTSTTLNASQTWSLKQHRLWCCWRQHTMAPVLRWAITLWRHGRAKLRVVLEWTYTTIPTTCLQCVKSTNISSVGSRRKVWRGSMTTCWSKESPLCISEASKTEIASRSSWLACQIIRLSGSGNYILLRIWDGMAITNARSNNGVQTSSTALDGWCSSQPTLSIMFTPHSVALIAIQYRNSFRPKCTLRTDGWRHR